MPTAQSGVGSLARVARRIVPRVAHLGSVVRAGRVRRDGEPMPDRVGFLDRVVYHARTVAIRASAQGPSNRALSVKGDPIS
jgi:hypothetical protein